MAKEKLNTKIIKQNKVEKIESKIKREKTKLKNNKKVKINNQKETIVFRGEKKQIRKGHIRKKNLYSMKI